MARAAQMCVLWWQVGRFGEGGACRVSETVNIGTVAVCGCAPTLPLYLDPLINAVCWTETGAYRGQASLEIGDYRGQTALNRGQASLESGVYRGQASHEVVFTAAKPP